VLVCHRLVLSRLLRSLFHQVLANLVGVDDRFFEREAILAPIAILDRPFGPANVAMPLSDWLGNHLDDSLWRLLLFSVDLPKMFDPCQVSLGPSRDPLGVPQQDRNSIDPKFGQVLALRALVDPRRLYSICANRALPGHSLPR
jgi:hypothetical protein